MYSNKKISKEIMNKLTKSITVLGNKENVVPNTLKRTFNFKGRKSIDIAKNLITSLTEKEDNIADPFAGSGSFVIAAAEADRKIIASELDNYTYRALKVLLEKYDKEVFDKLFGEVKEECYENIMQLYETKCCGVRNFINKLHFDPETSEYYNPTPHRDIKDGKNIIMLEACPICGNKTKVFEKFDEEQIAKINKLKTTKFPTHNLIENSRINITPSSGANRYDRNFTNRAKYALLLLQESIDKLPSVIERDILEHCLVASLALARVSQYGSGTEYIYQVMRFQAQEKNVWDIFESKCTNFINFKKDYPLAQVENVSDGSANISIQNDDYAVVFGNQAYANKFKLIYTDPPYTDQVAYLERSQLFRDWLGVFYDNNMKLTKNMLDKEIVVTNAITRPKKQKYSQYYEDIDKMFSIFYQALQNDGIVVFTIKLAGNKYFQTLAKYITLARKNGFEYALKFGIDKKDPTLRKQAAFNKTISKEMIVFFVKLTNENRYWYIDDTNYDFEIVKLLYNQIKKSENLSLLMSECISIVSKDLSKKHDIIMGEKEASKVKSLIAKEFSVLPNSLVCINPDNLYLEIEDSTDIFTKLYNTVPIVIRQLLLNSDKFSLDDLYFEMLNVICNGDPKALQQVLDSDNHQQQIQNLIDNYCNLQGKYYTKKILKNEPCIGATDISTMGATEFETLIKQLLDAMGYVDVFVSGQAGDRGVDIYAKKEDNGTMVGCIFQCKRWAANVGSEPIQRLHSMRTQLSPEFSRGICITTSNYTVAGKNEAKNTGIQIIGGSQLLEMLNQYFPNNYYHGALDFSKPE